MFTIDASYGFSEPACIKDNIDFWYDIYTKKLDDEEIEHSINLGSTNISSKKSTRKQSGLKARFAEGVKRESFFWPTVVKYLDEVPWQLGLLPHVESSFNPAAVSKVGAVGMWQIMPSTGRMYNIKDKRVLKDPNVSSKLAIKILKENYSKTGSWPLALTAYNHGLGGVMRAIKKTNSNDFCTIIKNYSGPKFKFASKNFYAQFLAVVRIRSENGVKK